MTSTAIRFHSNQLSAAIHYPIDQQQSSFPTIIFVHGFVGSKVGDHRLFVKAANFFVQKGFICFRFDFRGCGESDGDYQEVTVTKQLEELRAAIHYVSTLNRVNPEQIILIGHSLGGAITALSASSFPSIQNIVLWSPVARPYLDIRFITGDEAILTAEKKGTFDYKGFLLSHDFFRDLNNHDPLEAITSYEGSIFIIHGDQDQEVPKENVATYRKVINEKRNEQLIDVSYISGADHTFTNTSWENELFHKTNKWLENVLNPRS
ncbi:alpha/beta hydrolase family protein [Halalkalibacter alkalisediminis]|uniref:Alpha/beta hydrolase family protein n=1 Tax=Halalkalibacter alkalisediminis TaxID=935616 RepID=A0ABV6NBW3_9BACI|nr:alpha/beta fold hydrolase [Halalkalibacter alkalisediminis]